MSATKQPTHRPAQTTASPPQRMDGYIRVSRVMGREGDGYISPAVQREAIERWAEYKGIEISEWHIDEDQTGGDTNRPGLEAAITRVLDGDSGGIVSWKIDRFSRNTEDGLRGLRQLEARNARLAFVVEDIDTSGVMGKFVYTIMLAMATYFLDSIKASWVDAKTRAMARGAKIGPTPLGYRRNQNGTLRVHGEEAGVVGEAFRLAAQRGPAAALALLEGAGLTHEKGKRKGQPRSWTLTTVRRLLAQRIYLGELRHEGLPPVDDENLRLVDRATFEAAQYLAAPRRAKSTYPLSGLARCGTCGEAMVGARAGKSQRTYRCRASLTLSKGSKCPAPATTLADPLEQLVRETLRPVLAGVEFGAMEPAGLDELEAAMGASELELDEFLSDIQGAAVLRRVGRYVEALTARTDVVERDRAAYRDAASRAAGTLSATPDELLADDNPEGLAELVAAGIAITVDRGRGPLVDRLTITAGDSPVPAVLAT